MPLKYNFRRRKKNKNKTPKTILSLGVEVGVVKFLRPNMKMTPTFSTNGYYFIRDLFLALMWKELSTKLFNQSLNRISEPPSIGWNIEVSKENMHNRRTPLLGIELFQNWTIRSKLKKEHLIYPRCHIDF